MAGRNTFRPRARATGSPKNPSIKVAQKDAMKQAKRLAKGIKPKTPRY